MAKPAKLLAAPLRSVLSLSLAPFVYYRNLQSDSIKKSMSIESEHGVESIEAVELGGLKQWLLIRGQHVDNPILLFLHGGPGLPLMPFHPIMAGLEEDFTVVHWDQRGAGKSYQPHIPTETMTSQQLLNDTVELIHTLLERFQKKKLFLVGYSCGSVLGMTIANQYPELLHGYIGVGQIANMKESESLSYEHLLDLAADSPNPIALKEVQKIGPPPYRSHRAMLEQRMWLNSLGGFFYDKAVNLRFYKTGFLAPDYSATDIKKVFKGMDFVAKHLWLDFYETNLFESAPKVTVPTYFIAGRHDFVVPQAVLERYFYALENHADKSLYWFENSAHWPFLEEPDAFCQTLKDIKNKTKLE